ncbi:hypothetical protein HK098_008057 [Nowakowskiella sp. JEL0407]|nr:hypothetical protein HK098_008057 [Nowakowskiella sp. JEL0407]
MDVACTRSFVAFLAGTSYGVRLVTGSGSPPEIFTSPTNISVSAADFTPCSAPLYSPVTLTNVSAVKFDAPGLYAIKPPNSIICHWEYINSRFSDGSISNPLTVELVKVVGLSNTTNGSSSTEQKKPPAMPTITNQTQNNNLPPQPSLVQLAPDREPLENIYLTPSLAADLGTLSSPNTSNRRPISENTFLTPSAAAYMGTLSSRNSDLTSGNGYLNPSDVNEYGAGSSNGSRENLYMSQSMSPNLYAAENTSNQHTTFLCPGFDVTSEKWMRWFRIFLLAQLYVSISVSQSVTGWTISKAIPRAGELATIKVIPEPPEYLFSNSTWEILDELENVLDVAGYALDGNSVLWNIPKTFPSSTKNRVRLTSNIGTFTSRDSFTTTTASFMPCDTPPFYPTTMNNVSRVRFNSPGLLEIDDIYSSISTSLSCIWTFSYGPWFNGSGINMPITAEIVMLNEFVMPGEEMHFGSLVERTSGEPTYAQFSLNSSTPAGPAACRISFTAAGDTTVYSFHSDAFFLDIYNMNIAQVCPLNAARKASTSTSIALSKPTITVSPSNQVSQNANKDGETSNAGMIVGVAGALIVIFGGGTFGYLYFVRRRSRVKSEASARLNDSLPPPPPPFREIETRDVVDSIQLPVPVPINHIHVPITTQAQQQYAPTALPAYSPPTLIRNSANAFLTRSVAEDAGIGYNAVCEEDWAVWDEKFSLMFLFALIVAQLCLSICKAQNVVGWKFPSTVPRAGSSASIDLITNPSYQTLVNATYEIIDGSGNTLDVAAYGETRNYIYWNIPKNFPSGTYGVRLTTSTGTFTSPINLTVSSGDFTPCSAPPYYPTTINNVSAVRFDGPSLASIQTLYSSSSLTNKIYCYWDFIYGPWYYGSSINSPVSTEVLLLKEFVMPGSKGQIVSVLGSGTGSFSSATVELKSSQTGPAVCRMNFTRPGDSVQYSYVGDPFFIAPSGSYGKCPVDSNSISSGSSSGSSSNSGGGSGSSSTGIIIGIIAGVIVICCIVAFVVLYYVRKNRVAKPAVVPPPAGPYVPPVGPYVPPTDPNFTQYNPAYTQPYTPPTDPNFPQYNPAYTQPYIPPVYGYPQTVQLAPAQYQPMPTLPTATQANPDNAYISASAVNTSGTATLPDNNNVPVQDLSQPKAQTPQDPPPQVTQPLNAMQNQAPAAADPFSFSSARAGETSSISISNSYSFSSDPLFKNLTWLIVDSNDNVLDVASYNANNYISWIVPKNFPSGVNYGVRVLLSNGTWFGSSKTLTVTTADFSPCTAPPYYPTTLSNYSAVRFTSPDLMEKQNVYTYSNASVSCDWKFVNKVNDSSTSLINYPVSVEVLGIKQFKIPGSSAEIAAVLGQKSSTSVSYGYVSVARGFFGPAICRVNFTRAGDETKYSFVGDPFFLVDFSNSNWKCDQDAFKGKLDAGAVSGSSGQGFNISGIIGAVVGVLGFICIAICLCSCFRRRVRQSQLNVNQPNGQPIILINQQMQKTQPQPDSLPQYTAPPSYPPSAPIQTPIAPNYANMNTLPVQPMTAVYPSENNFIPLSQAPGLYPGAAENTSNQYLERPGNQNQIQRVHNPYL